MLVAFAPQDAALRPRFFPTIGLGLGGDDMPLLFSCESRRAWLLNRAPIKRPLLLQAVPVSSLIVMPSVTI